MASRVILSPMKNIFKRVLLAATASMTIKSKNFTVFIDPSVSFFFFLLNGIDY